MKKKILKITLWLVGLISLLIIVSVLLVYINRDKVKAIIVTELNKQLLTEIKVSSIDIEFFSTFPRTSLTINDVLAYDAFPKEKQENKNFEAKTHDDTLFYFKKLHLTFNVWDILSENYNIKTIIAKDGCFNMKVNQKAQVNYEFWKSSESKKESNFALSLKKITLNNIKYSYRNDLTKQYFEIYLNSSNAKGNFNEKEQDITISSKSRIRKIQLDNLLISDDRNLDFEIDYSNNTLDKKMQIKAGKLLIDGLSFNISGYLEYKKTTYISLSVDGNEINLNQMLVLMPKNYSKYFKDYESKGELVFNFNMKGFINNTHMPSVNSNFTIKNGELTNKKAGITFTNINLKGYFSNGEKKDSESSYINIDNFYLKWNNGVVKGYAQLFNFSNLTLDAKIDCDLPLTAIHKLIQKKEITQLNGQLKLNFNIKGDLRSIENVTDKGFREIQMSGNGNINNLNYSDIRIKQPIKNLSSNFIFNNTTIEIQKLNGFIGSTLVGFNGSIEDIIPYVFKQNKRFNLLGDLKLGTLKIDDWVEKPIQTTTKEKISTKNTKAPQSEPILPTFFNADLNLDISKLIYSKSELSNIKSKLKLINGNLILNDLIFNAWGGKLAGDVSLLLNTKNPKIIGDVNIIKVNSTKLFYSMDNFGQSFLTNQNIGGEITSKINFSSELDKNFNFLEDKLIVKANYKIEDGRLKDVELIKKLSYFIDESALGSINFEEILSSVSINNSCITIDEINIKSNAINFSILGKHYFNKNIDYRAKIKLSELSSKKKKAKLEKAKKEFGDIEQDENSRVSLFVKITGTTDKPIFSYDTKKNIEIAKQKLKADQKKISFSIDKDLNLGINEMKKDKQNWKHQEKGEYIIEWEEEKKDSIFKTDEQDQTKFNIEW